MIDNFISMIVKMIILNILIENILNNENINFEYIQCDRYNLI